MLVSRNIPASTIPFLLFPIALADDNRAVFLACIISGAAVGICGIFFIACRMGFFSCLCCKMREKKKDKDKDQQQRQQPHRISVPEMRWPNEPSTPSTTACV